MSGPALPGQDAARPPMRIAFTLAWLVGALIATALVVGAAGAAARAAEPAGDGQARLAAAGSAAPPADVGRA